MPTPRSAEACKAAGKVVSIKWWSALELEDRKTYIVDADVLRPTSIPADPAVRSYIQPFKYAPILRTGTSLGQARVFASDAGRNLLEQELLKAGVQIRRQSPRLGLYQRPLGNMLLETLGFGSTLVTFRNCPNNCPLALWAGDPWYLLFPRKTNEFTCDPWRSETTWPAKAPSSARRASAVRVLGRLLMELRELIRAPEAESFRRVDPPRVPRCLLYGRPVVALEAPVNLATAARPTLAARRPRPLVVG